MPIQRAGKRKRSDSDEESEEESPKKKQKVGNLGDHFFEASARSEASMRRKLRRHSKHGPRIAALAKRLEASKEKPSETEPFLQTGDSFFHLAEAVTGASPAEPKNLKLHALPSVYVNTRQTREADGPQPIEPASMMVDPGGDYSAMRTTEKDLSKKTSGGDLVDFMLRPMNKGDYDPSRKVGPMEKVSNEERLRRDRDAVGMKFLTRGVEPIRREGEFTHTSLELLLQKEADKPSLEPLTSEQGMMTPTSATSWHYNEQENQRQLEVFGQTARSVAAYSGDEPNLTAIRDPTKKLKKAVEKKNLEKTRKAQRPLINAMLRMHNKIEDLGFDEDDMVETDNEEDNYHVTRTVRKTVDPMSGEPKPRKRVRARRRRQVRVGKGSRDVQRASDKDHDQLVDMVKSGKLQSFAIDSPQKKFVEKVNAEIKKGDKTAPAALTFRQLRSYLHHYGIVHRWKMPRFRTPKGAGSKGL